MTEEKAGNLFFFTCCFLVLFFYMNFIDFCWNGGGLCMLKHQACFTIDSEP